MLDQLANRLLKCKWLADIDIDIDSGINIVIGIDFDIDTNIDIDKSKKETKYFGCANQDFLQNCMIKRIDLIMAKEKKRILFVC